MADPNPFAAPGASAGGEAAQGVAWAEGETLVTDPRAVLPLVCAKCGTQDDVVHVRLKAAWVPMWVRLTIIASPIVLLVLWFIFRKRYDIQLGLCGKHRTARMVGRWGGTVLLLGGLLGMFVGIGIDDVTIMFGGVVVMLVGVILAVVIGVPLRPTRVTDTQAEFAGAHAGLLDAVGRG